MGINNRAADKIGKAAAEFQGPDKPNGFGNVKNIKEADVERSTEDIHQDIAKGKENISQTVEQIAERIKEKLDWRGYVKDAPYWARGLPPALAILPHGCS